MPNRLTTLSSNPLLVNFARDAGQSAIRPVAKFLAPLCEVPDLTGPYKIYDADSRYKPPQTRKTPGRRATQIGFEASDGTYTLTPNALDFPIPNAKGLSDERLRYYAQYGVSLLADASGLSHENEVIQAALAAAGAGSDTNFTDAAVDPIAILNADIMTVMLAAKNGAAIKVLFGATALRRTQDHPLVRGRLTGGGTSDPAVASIESLQRMLFGNPKCEVALLVKDTSAAGKAESISFLLDTQIIIFASSDTPNTMDPSFMKTFVPMGSFFVPGSYQTEDERDEVLKMDWTSQIIVTNSTAVVRRNANNA